LLMGMWIGYVDGPFRTMKQSREMSES
jgi:hypothetical protein